VTRFLSPEWIDAFNAALADVTVAPPGPEAGLAVRDGRFSMRQVVTGGPDGDVQATLRVVEGRVTMTGAGPGGAADAAADGGEPAVTIRLSWDDAVSMAAGALAPAEAIAAGRVRVRGDLSVLAEAQAVLGAVQSHLQKLRDLTEY
jgi:putative sterol carrier protein